MNGGSFFDEDAGVAKFTEPAFVEALQWMADLQHVYQVSGEFDGGHLDREGFFDPYLNPSGLIAFAPTMTPGYSEIRDDYLRPAIRRVMDGEAPASVALQEIYDPVNAILQAASRL